MRVWKPVALAGAVLLLAIGAGCGGGGGGGSSGGTSARTSSGGLAADGAAALPASAAAFIAVSTDFESDQWKQIQALAAKFPGYDSLLAKGRKQLADQGLDFEQDVKPALGPEVDLAWLDFKSSDDFVFVTKPPDPDKLDALLAKTKEPPARADVNGYVALAQTKTLLDAASSATAHLSDDPSFKEAMAALPGGDVARAYLNGAQLQSALQAAIDKSSSSGSTPFKLPTTPKLDWIAASGAAQSDGVRIDSVAKVEPAPKIASFAAELPTAFAAGAIVYAGFANLDQAAKSLLEALGKSSPDLNTQLGQLEGVSGISLDKDVVPLLKNEGAVAVYPSTQKVPTIVFALKVEDEAKAQKLLDQLGALAGLAGGGGGGGPTPANVPGYPSAKQLKVGSTSIVYGTANGRLVVSNTAAGLQDVGASGPKLADDALYKAAKDGAKMPDETTGFVYVDLKTGLPLILGLAQSQGTKIPPEVKQNTAPLQSALFYGTTDGELIRVTGFAGIQ